MYIAIDDTDFPGGMCTTYLMTEVIHRLDLDLIGFPGLVRLNPNIPYKTRGNAALTARLGTGRGEAIDVGRYGSRKVLSWNDCGETGDPEEVAGLVLEIVKEKYGKHPNTNPGIVVSSTRFPSWFYREALRREIMLEEAMELLEKEGASYRYLGNGRGLIGATAAISWEQERTTYELLGYDHAGPRPDNGRMIGLAREIDSIPGTFASMDEENQRATIFPSPRTPVYLGIRGHDHVVLRSLMETLQQHEETRCGRYMLFVTNQGTDDNVVEEPEQLTDLLTCSITGTVASLPVGSDGGHWFCDVNWRGMLVRTAAYEESGSLASAFRMLRPGDMVQITGSYNSGNLNLEKLNVITQAEEYRRAPSICSCGSFYRNVGKSGLKCPSCGDARGYHSYTLRSRARITGIHLPPVSSRRHLSAYPGSRDGGNR